MIGSCSKKGKESYQEMTSSLCGRFGDALVFVQKLSHRSHFHHKVFVRIPECPPETSRSDITTSPSLPPASWLVAGAQQSSGEIRLSCHFNPDPTHQVGNAICVLNRKQGHPSDLVRPYSDNRWLDFVAWPAHSEREQPIWSLLTSGNKTTETIIRTVAFLPSGNIWPRSRPQRSTDKIWPVNWPVCQLYVPLFEGQSVRCQTTPTAKFVVTLTKDQNVLGEEWEVSSERSRRRHVLTNTAHPRPAATFSPWEGQDVFVCLRFPPG